MKFTFKKYDFKNTEILSNIYKECFGVNKDVEYFEWKYKLNPAGKAIGFIAEHEGEVAAFYGVIPETYIVNGKTTTFYQSMDTMTLPKYQRKGLFVKLAKLTYEYLENINKELSIIGFPGETSYGGFVTKLNWRVLIKLNYVFLHKNLFKLNRIVKNETTFKVDRVDDFDERFDVYFNQRQPSIKPIHKLLHRNELNWRYAAYSRNRYVKLRVMFEDEIVGFVVYTTDDKNRVFLNCIDFVNISGNSKLLKMVMLYIFDNTKATYIYTLQPNEISLRNNLKRMGFVKNRADFGPFSYKTPIILYGTKEYNDVDIFNVNNWNLQPYLRDY